MKKKWLSCLLSLAMVTSTLSPAAVGAEDWFSAEETIVTEEPYEFESVSPEIYEEGEWETDDAEWETDDAENFLSFSGEETEENAEEEDVPNQELPEVSRTVSYYQAVPFYKYGTSYKNITPAEYFENGSDYTYEINFIEGDPLEWNEYNGLIQVPITSEFEKSVFIVTAKDEEGNAVGSVAFEILGVALKAAVTNEDDFYFYVNESNQMPTYTYVYNEEDTELVTAHIETEAYIGGERVNELPEGMELKWNVSNDKNVVLDEANRNITLDKVNAQTVVYPFISLEEGTDRYNRGAYVPLCFRVYPRRMQFTPDVYQVSMPEDGYLPNPVNLSWGDSIYYGQDCTIKCLDPDIAEVSLSYSTISVTPKKTGTARVLAQWNTDVSNCTVFKIEVLGVSIEAEDGSGSRYIYLDPEDEASAQLQLKAQGTKRSESFTWSSTDETIAAVDENGLVTAFKEGPVTIYAVSSLSTEETPVKGALRLEVIENKKPYLSNMSFDSYIVFEGWTGSSSDFHSAQYEYDMKIKESYNYVSTLEFTPNFNEEKIKAVLLSQEYGGDYKETVLENGVKVSKLNALEPGWNKIYIDVTDKEDEENTARYTFNVYRPYTTSNTIIAMTALPNGQTALTYPTYKNSREGTIFQYDPETEELGSAYFTNNVYNYKIFVFGERTGSIAFTPVFEDINEHVYLRKDGGEMQIQTNSWSSAEQELNETGVTKFTFEVMSDQAYADAKQEAEEAGTELVFTPENTYNIYVEKVSPLGIDAKILSAELTGAEFYAPGFTPGTYNVSALVDSGAEECSMRFTVPEGIEVFKDYIADAYKLEGTQTDDNEEGVLTYEITIPMSGNQSYFSINLRKWNEDESESGSSAYTFSFNKRGPKDAIPDSVEEYLCIGSQYTNKTSFGQTPERTLVNGGGVLSVGGFGGYITWKYDTPIENSANNPYGVDFIVYGNPFAAMQGAAEPGNVMVSQDGVNWYYLAGSVHYDDDTDWNFSVTYANDTGSSSWTDSDGNSGTIYEYPKTGLYPLYNWESEDQQSVTVSGVHLNNNTKDPYGSASAAYPDFGYVDVNVVGELGTAGNPYIGEHGSCGDGFDIDWAVDENGMPVHLDSISYIRVSTANHIYAGAIGEKSTEVRTMYRVLNTAETAVGRTDAPASITVNGAEVSLDSQVTTIDYTGEALDVKVSVPEGTNVYINGAYGTERSYETAPVHRIIRVITQEGEKEPDIRYIRLHQIVSASEIALDASEKTVKEGESFTLTAAMTPEDAVDTVSWTSSDESVAAVADGVVTGVKSGTAVITARTTGGASAECTVTVECIHSGKILLIIDTPATCTSEGAGHRICTLCGKITEEKVILPIIAHKWGEWKVTKEAGYDSSGEKERTCSVCGEKITEVIGRLGRNDISGAAVTGITDMIYTGKELTLSALSVQTADGKTLINGTDYTVEYRGNVNIGTADVIITGKGAYEGTIRKTFDITVKKGGTYTVGTLKYKITNARTNGKGTVALAGTTKTKAKLTSLTVDSTVIIGGKSFMITSIGDKAFRNYTKLKSVSLGLNIKLIGKQAFSGCKNLKTILITSRKLKTVEKYAIKNINKKAVIDVTDSKVKSYKKLFKSSTGFKSTMKIK